jgi:hypothetical protein
MMTMNDNQGKSQKQITDSENLAIALVILLMCGIIITALLIN